MFVINKQVPMVLFFNKIDFSRKLVSNAKSLLSTLYPINVTTLSQENVSRNFEPCHHSDSDTSKSSPLKYSGINQWFIMHTGPVTTRDGSVTILAQGRPKQHQDIHYETN